MVRASLRPSKIHGVGCFTDEPIRAGQSVWVFDERIDVRLTVSELAKFPPTFRDFLRFYGYEEMHDGHRTIVLCGDHARHMNHSDTPNLIDSESNIAAHDIEAGEELTCNYYAFDLDAHRKLSDILREPRNHAAATLT